MKKKIVFSKNYYCLLFFYKGCLNSPAKGSRYCKQHKPISVTFIDEKDILNCKEPSAKRNRTEEEKEKEDYSVVKILGSKEIDGIVFCEVSFIIQYRLLCKLQLEKCNDNSLSVFINFFN